MQVESHSSGIGKPLSSLIHSLSHFWIHATRSRGKTPELVRQEVWGLLLAHFAVRGLRHEAALRAGEDPDRLSFLHAVRVVRRKLPRFAALPPSGQARPA